MRVPLGAMGESQANAHRKFRPVSPFPAGRHKLVSVAIADCRLTFTTNFLLGFEPIVEIATIPFATETSLKKSTSNSHQTKLRPCGVSKSMLTSACEFAQDELLSQTADDMQTQIYPKSLEYMPGSTI
jgi:hypothetical protein